MFISEEYSKELASLTTSTCERYAAECTKTGPEILRVQKREKRETHLEKPEKGNTGYVLGADGDEGGCG